MTYVSKRMPREKQAEALKKSKGKEAFAFLMAMRTGKTKVVLDEYGTMASQGKVHDLLVIAPAGVYRTWEGAIELDLGIAAEVHTWKSGGYGSQKAKRELQEFLDIKGPRILLMNVEALSSVEMARATIAAFLKDRKVYVAIDESTVIKNPSAKRTKYINKAIRDNAAVRRIMSGLVTPRSPMDLYSQFEFLDPRILGHKSFYTFRAQYAIMRQMDFGGRLVPIIVGYRDVEDLQQRIKPHSFRVRLEDCYDLPPSTYAIREVPLTKEQERIYKELKEFATASLGKERHVTATIVITQILRLHQVLCGHTVDENGQWMALPERRTETLIELLEEHEGKAIIWCSYDHDVRKVSEALAKAFKVKVARFWGGNRATREEEEKMFKTDPACPYMVATAQAGGRGRTWDVANLVVYYSCTNDLEYRSQSEERPKGVDKKTPISYVDLMVPGTVEAKIIHALRNKIDVASIINGDNYREWLI